MESESGTPLLSLEGVGKRFGENQVLSDINFSMKSGEILGLVGENGAGKSTLMKILFGMPEITDTGGFDGKVLLNGQAVNFKSPMDALAAGIGMVHQEFSLIPGFTSTENIMLNTELTRSSVLSKILGKRLATLDRKAMRQRAQKAIDTLGVDVDPDTLVSEMPVGHKQFVEIAREISRENVKVIIFDEPTAVLTEIEAEILLAAMRKLAEAGIALIFISHRLAEIISICDRLVVLRDGALVTDQLSQNVTIEQIAELMVGREVKGDAALAKNAKIVDDEAEVILEINNLWVDMPGEFVNNVSLQVRRGEIFGIGGLAGHGKLGIPNGIMGLYPAGGEVLFKGEPVELNSPLKALHRGLAFVSEDRRGVGLLLDEPIDWNVAFNAMQVHNKFLKSYLGGLIKFRDEKAMRECARGYIESLEIRCTSEKQRVKQLSGGNQQKVCLAKAFAFGPELLFVSEPTRGIDIGAKTLVLDTLRHFSIENNTTIVIVSSELEELRSICQRIAIICNGEVAGILPSNSKAVDFGLLMSGEAVSTDNTESGGKEGDAV